VNEYIATIVSRWYLFFCVYPFNLVTNLKSKRMKKIYFYAGLVIAHLQVQSVLAQQISFETFLLTSTETFWDGSDYSGAHLEGIFTSNYVEGEFKFLNVYDTTFSAEWGYWSEGWAFSNLTPNNVSGVSGTYNSFAGGAAVGSSYALGKRGSEIYINPELNEAVMINSLAITNSSYAALSMLNGDFFGKQFGSTLNANGEVDGTNGEDWFLLEIVGHKLDGTTDTVEFYLADYRFSDDADDYIVDEWTSLDLSSLGYLSKLEFLLSSSDTGDFGMNTPGFFALDNIQYTITSTASLPEANNLTEIAVYPNPTNGLVNLISNEAIQQLNIVDIAGKVVSTQNMLNGVESIDLTFLPPGTYNMVITTHTGTSIRKLIKY
jgi:hypothetical protein